MPTLGHRRGDTNIHELREIEQSCTDAARSAIYQDGLAFADIGDNVSAELAKRIQSLQEGITERLVRLMQARAPEISKEDLFWAAEISLGVFRGVLPTITALKGSRRNRAIREIKALFSRYWEPVLEAGRKTRAIKS